MKIPLIDLSGQHRQIRSEAIKAIHEIFDSQRFVLGENVREFETAIAKDTGARFAIGLASGTDALHLALLAMGIGAGDEVITTPFTFFATAGAISRTGAKPVFADIDSATYNLDPEEFKRKITSRTKAVIPVHLFGLPCQKRFFACH
jgi:dTDP-4-amino-4,6-dideoxygalactose transaminase